MTTPIRPVGAVAPAGFFIEGAKKNGVWGGTPENFLLDHAVYFGCNCD